DIGRSRQGIFEITLEVEQDFDVVLPISPLGARARNRRLSHDSRGFELITLDRCLDERGSVGSAEPGIHESDDLTSNQFDLEFYRLFFFCARRWRIDCPGLSANPRADESRRRRALRWTRQQQA